MISKFIFSLLNKLTEALVDDEGFISSMRLCFIFSSYAIIGVWLYICLRNGEFIHFSEGDAAVIGLIFGAKALQSLFENKYK